MATRRLLTRNLLDNLQRLRAETSTIYWMTVILMKSGVN